MKTIQEAIRFGRAKLKGKSQTAALDAELLLGHTIKTDRSVLYTWPQRELVQAEGAIYQNLLSRREKGEPVAYILGVQEFFGYDFEVNSDVLIPRPDTEKLVETALSFLPQEKPFLIIDVCTGSGCIAIVLALARSKIQVVATDISPQALKVALSNAKHHRVSDRVTFRQGNLLESCRDLQQVDLIVANPPYIRESAMLDLMRDVRDFEPHLALQGRGKDGLLHHRLIVEAGISLLKPGGHLILEIGYDQRPDVEIWAFDKLSSPRFIKDDAGYDRLVCYEKLGAL